MFNQLFKRDSTIARHATAPFAEERARYLDYCRQRGDSHARQLCKAYDLLWIARQMGPHSDWPMTLDQLQGVVGEGGDEETTEGPNLRLLSTRKRLIGNACAWLRYLGQLREPVEPIPFGLRLDEYCDWAKHERGLSDTSIDRFRRDIRQFLCWYGPLGRPLSRVEANDIDAYLAVGSDRGWARVTRRNVVDALRAFFRYGAQQGWCPARLPEAIQGPRIYAQETLPAGPPWAEVERLFAGLDTHRSTDVRDRAILMLLAI